MSSPDSDRFLKIATVVAFVALVIGGSFYFGAVLRTDDPAPSADQAPVRAAGRGAPPATAGHSGADADSEAAQAVVDDSQPIRRLKDPMSGPMLAMATRPTVLPATELAGVEEELSLALPDIQLCWKGAVGENASDSKLFVHFSVNEDGEVADLTVRSKGIGVPSVHTCFSDMVGKRVFGNTEPGTSVYWPIILDPETGPRLR